MKTKTDIYQKITNTIIELLESVKAGDYKKSWLGFSELANNPTTNKTYSGINQFWLSYLASKKGFSTNRWMTFKQAAALGGKIKKGSKATEIVYNDFLYYDDKGNKLTKKAIDSIKATLKSGETLQKRGIKTIPFVKFFYGFNIDQIEGLKEDLYVTEIDTLEEFTPIEKGEMVILNSEANVRYVQGDRAYYNLLSDQLTLPLRKQFAEAEGFYSTAFHELVHWTGHPERLNRLKGSEFGSPEYAYEELIAELGAAFINAACGFESQINSNAAYINSWLTALRNDKKFIFKASSKAQQASKLLTEGLTQKDQVANKAA